MAKATPKKSTPKKQTAAKQTVTADCNEELYPGDAVRLSVSKLDYIAPPAISINLPSPLPTTPITTHVRHVEINHLTARQRDALARIKQSLDGTHTGTPAKLNQSGRFVDSNANALRWLLDRIADQVEGKTAHV